MRAIVYYKIGNEIIDTSIDCNDTPGVAPKEQAECLAAEIIRVCYDNYESTFAMADFYSDDEEFGNMCLEEVQKIQHRLDNNTSSKWRREAQRRKNSVVAEW